MVGNKARIGKQSLGDVLGDTVDADTITLEQYRRQEEKASSSVHHITEEVISVGRHARRDSQL
jgi:hypothetical protein